MFVHKLLLDYFASLDMVEGAYKSTGESKPPEVVSPTSETLDDVREERKEEPTTSSILVPVVSEIPFLLSCGHEQRNPDARFCSICGRPVSAGTLEQ